MSAFKPGDLVIAIDPDNACGLCIDLPFAEGDGIVEVGRAVVVAEVVAEPCPALIFNGDDDCYSSCCFRKIDKADEEFTEQVRAFRPIKQREGQTA